MISFLGFRGSRTGLFDDVSAGDPLEAGICGQAPSDYPEFAASFVEEGIDSISLNPDSVIEVERRVAEVEKKRH